MDKIKGILPGHSEEYAAQLYAGTVGHECGEEYVLPDYMPAVQRIVSVSARPLPEGKYASGDTVELSGTIAYTIIYSDSDGALTGFSPSGDYSVSAPFSGEDDSYVAADTKVISVSCRATAPRKLLLKARMQSAVRCIGKRTAALDLSANNSDEAQKVASGIQKLEKEHRTMEAGGGSSCASFSGMLRGGNGLTPLYCDGVPCITEAKPEQDTIHIRGELYVKCTCKDEAGSLVTIGDRILFEDEIDSAGVTADTASRCWGRCASLTVTPSDDGSGNMNCSGEIDLECEWMRPSSILITEDMYSSSGECETSSEKLELLEPAACASSRLTANGRFPCSTDQGEYVLSCISSGETDKITVEDGKIYLEGTCTVKAVIAGGEINEREFSIPFKCRFDPPSGSISDGEIIYRADVSAIDTAVRLDGSEADVNAELFISLGAAVRRNADAVTRAVLSEGSSQDSDKIMICYTSGGERLWDIGKKYHASMDELRRLNGDDTGKFVIIAK